MSNFPSIEEFDSGHVIATRVEDGKDDMDLFDSAPKDFLAREQAILGDDAEFFQATNTPSQQAAFFGGNQGRNILYVDAGADDSDEDIHEFETSFPSIETTVR
jgi:hypothetical protein